MSTLTIRIPEMKHARLGNLAKARGISVNRLMDELATIALAEHDTEASTEPWQQRGLKTSVSHYWRSSIGRSLHARLSFPCSN